MKLEIEPGFYVVAVSGGVDSMVLLDMLAGLPDVTLIVAHFNHGIRDDSDADEELVARTARAKGLLFVSERGNLGAHASEADARTARYAFLEKVMKREGARAIITAHHQDDVLESILLALLRGTGRKGLSALQSTKTRKRPLLYYTKNELIAYAQTHATKWREDSTNQDDTYLRNYVRKTFIPRMKPAGRQQLLDIHRQMVRVNAEADALLAGYIEAMSDDGIVFVRSMFIMMPHAISKEVMASLLRSVSARDVSRRTIERLVVAVKVARPHTMHDVDNTWVLIVDKKTWQLCPRVSRKSY